MFGRLSFRWQHLLRVVSGLLGLFLVLGVLGCDTKESPDSNDPTTYKPTTKNETQWSKDHWTQVKPSAQRVGRVDPQYGRQARRLSVLHLKRIVPRLFNGLKWTDSRKNDLFARLARTLGQADYIFATQSHRKPTMLFMKFMDDMAGNLCDKAVKADTQNKQTSGRMLIRYPRDPDRNLRFLRLKFHTILVPKDSSDGIKRFRGLYDKVLRATQDSSKAWFAVCITMMTSPEFFAY